MSPALRHPNGPAFDTNALQVSSSAWPVGRLCQAARGAGSKGEVLGPVAGKNARPPRAHPISPDVRMSQPLGGALVRNMHAEFPRLDAVFTPGTVTTRMFGATTILWLQKMRRRWPYIRGAPSATTEVSWLQTRSHPISRRAFLKIGSGQSENMRNLF
jgi:hypothetical protein